jgi:hypothetical protein
MFVQENPAFAEPFGDDLHEEMSLCRGGGAGGSAVAHGRSVEYLKTGVGGRWMKIGKSLAEETVE